MEKTTGRILRADTIKLGEHFRLEIGQIPAVSAGAEQANQVSANKTKAALVPAQVRIVENNPEFVVMEVTCGCGTKTQIRCEYPAAPADAQEAHQENNGENNDAS